jgi:hypothetical protein
MELIGKKVKHSVYGTGIVKAFYKSGRTIWISYSDCQPKPYSIPEVFDSKFLSTEDEDIMEAIKDIKNNPVYKYSKWQTVKKKSKNKNLWEFVENSCAILDELGIKHGDITEVDTITTRKVWGICLNSELVPNTFKMVINDILLRDSTSDCYLYDTVLHELLHTVDDGIGHGHGKAFHKYARIIESRCGYSVASRATYDRDVEREHDEFIIKFDKI